ncbi:unknown [Firmicutes bacterium CAG:170]|nr:unknown [Firmicutes bacterium CAG:170]
MEECRILAVRIGLRNRAFLVGEAAAVEVAGRNLLGQIDRCGIIRNADTVSRIDGRRVSDYLVGLVAGVDELAVRAHPDMNDLIVRVIDRRHGERRNRLAINIDAGVFCVVRREAKAPALFVDGLDGDSKNDLLAAGLAVVRADPVRGIIKARYRDGFTDNICFVLIRIVVIAPRRRVAVSVDGGAGLGVNLNLTRAIHAFIQIKVIGDGVLEDGRCRQRDACAADLLTDRLEDARQVNTGCRRAVVLGGNRCSSARQARRVRIVGGNIVHVIGCIGARSAAEAAAREDRGSAVFEGLGCGDCAVSNRSFKGVAACRLTVGEHNGDLFAAAVRVLQNGLRMLHTEVRLRCASCL